VSSRRSGSGGRTNSASDGTRPRPRLTPHPILLHGFTGSSQAWGPRIIDGLAGAGLIPVLVDLPGHGRHIGDTDPSAFALEAALSLVESAGHTPAPLIGYSMGGRVALHYAVRCPERVTRLVLESSSPGLATSEERSARRATDAALAERILEEGVEAFVDQWETLPLFASQARLPDELRGAVRARRLANDPGSLAASLRGLGTGSLPSLWERLSDLPTPTLILAGELDEKFVAIGEQMAGSMPDARLLVVRSAGHAVHLEQPEAWCTAVTSFLHEG
jgi:2-succinyl-6-hydroxy-2,4-cyclohexadiene-1-carboxylate synthase